MKTIGFFEHPAPTRLRPGMVIDLNGKRDAVYRVLTVNECVAVCVPVRPKEVVFRTLNGDTVRLLRTGKNIRISVNSESEVIR
jgi:hypothetical protein